MGFTEMKSGVSGARPPPEVLEENPRLAVAGLWGPGMPWIVASSPRSQSSRSLCFHCHDSFFWRKWNGWRSCKKEGLAPTWPAPSVALANSLGP